MTAKRADITIEQGTTFRKVWNWYGGGKVTREIDSVVVGCPTRITVAAHGLPAGEETPVYISDVKGARSLNTNGKEVLATYVNPNEFDVDTHTRNETYTAGTGCLVYYVSKDLTGWTARMDIRDAIDDTATLVSLNSADGDIVIDLTTAKITITIDADVTQALDFTDGVYDLELIDGDGAVTRLLYGDVALIKEVTRSI